VTLPTGSFRRDDLFPSLEVTEWVGGSIPDRVGDADDGNGCGGVRPGAATALFPHLCRLMIME
jgi:hypothetical protein